MSYRLFEREHGEHVGYGGHEDHNPNSGADMKRSLRVDSIFELIIACLIVAAITASYEWLREYARKVDERILQGELQRLRDETSPLLGVDRSSSNENGSAVRPSIHKLTNRQQLKRSILYAVQVLISMFIMLIFMTYNAYLMTSVVVGAGIGYYCFTNRTLSLTQDTVTRSVACH
ncbi:8322_t:CDS:2 [Ambispora gerdemannii]|uniref:Copper transport protein n=1 Tax=Ambispora gerdemannii TaxID=144530 RepID=A0A9N8YRN8_9GLOM|nr:8322_t:CDS:2 [Ambispora gerdemannii]